MLDRTDFRGFLSRALNGHGNQRGRAAVELHLHGGESFFLRCVKRVTNVYALCEVVPMHEYSVLEPESGLPPVKEAAIPYATMASVGVSSRRVASDHPVGFRRGSDSRNSDG